MADQEISLGAVLGTGGEGSVYLVNENPHLVAKIFHTDFSNMTAEERTRRTSQLRIKRKKVEAMAAAAPSCVTKDSHPLLAWPQLVVRSNSQVVGFVMPKLASKEHPLIHQVANASDRLTPSSGMPSWVKSLTWAEMVATGQSLCDAVSAAHAAGAVIGDMNESNILVDKKQRVTLVDVDSMQFRSNQGTIYHCTVAKPEYSAPEIVKKDLYSYTRDVWSDYYVLAIHIYTLLMDGNHPFQRGHWAGRGAKPEWYELKATGQWCGGPRSQLQPVKAMPSADSLPPQIIALFERAFSKGIRNPEQRPTPQEWKSALGRITTKKCRRDRQHVYSTHLSDCPWCAIDKRLSPGSQQPFLSLKQTSIPVSSVQSAAGQPAGQASLSGRQTGVAASTQSVSASSLARRFGATLAMTFIGVLAFLTGAVLTNIWQYPYMSSDALSFVAVASWTSADYFWHSLTLAAILGLVGDRWRSIRWLILAYAFVAGGTQTGDFSWSAPVFLSDFSHPGFIDTIMENIAHFPGGWLVYVAFFGAIGLWVATNWVGDILPDPPRRVTNARSARKQSVKQFLGAYSSSDQKMISMAQALIFTVIPAWAIGRFIMLDNFLIVSSALVYDPEARSFFWYLIAYWMAGTLVIVSGLGVFLLINRRTVPGQIGRVTGIALLIVALVSTKGIGWYWDWIESSTADTLRTTAFPFDDKYKMCRSLEALVPSEYGDDVLWQAYASRSQSASVDGCNRVTIYEGWERKGAFTLDEGLEVSEISWQEDTPEHLEDLVLIVTDSEGTTHSVYLPDY